MKFLVWSVALNRLIGGMSGLVLLGLLIPVQLYAQEEGPQGINTVIEAISVTDAPIADVLTLLAEESGLSFTSTKEVAGKVTVELNNVSVQTVLDVVLENNGWKYAPTSDGKIIQVMTKAQYDEYYRVAKPKETVEYTPRYVLLEDLVAAFRPLMSPDGKITPVKSANKVIIVDVPEVTANISKLYPLVDAPLVTQVFKLEYANADQVQKQLETMVQPKKGDLQVDKERNVIVLTTTKEKMELAAKIIKEFDFALTIEVFQIEFADAEDVLKMVKPLLTKEGFIDLDKKSSRIIVRDIPSKIKQVKEVIDQIDTPPLATWIEAEIVNLNMDRNFQLGVDWDLGEHVIAGPALPDDTGTVYDRTVRNVQDALYKLASGNFTYLDFTTIGDMGLSIALNAMESMGLSQTLASPRLLVMNDEEAEFNVGADEPFLVRQRQYGYGGGVGTDSEYYTQRSRQVGITLGVKPHIVPSGYVEMEVELEDSTPRRVKLSGEEALAVDKRIANTVLLVKDGRTVVVGGLIQRSSTDNRTGVPVLSKLPVLGAAFRSTTSESKRQKLLLFLTPRIVNPDDPYRSYQVDDSQKARKYQKDGIWSFQDQRLEGTDKPDDWIKTLPPDEIEYLPEGEQNNAPILMPGSYDDKGVYWTPGKEPGAVEKAAPVPSESVDGSEESTVVLPEEIVPLMESPDSEETEEPLDGQVPIESEDLELDKQ